MKHLKKFNEARNRPRDLYNLKELEELCNDHLIELLDNGFIFILEKTNRYNEFEFEFRAKPIGTFSWEVIKDKFLTFLEFMSSEYSIYNVNIHTGYNSMFKVNLEDMLKDDTDIFFGRDERPIRKAYNDIYDYSESILAITFNIEL